MKESVLKMRKKDKLKELKLKQENSETLIKNPQLDIISRINVRFSLLFHMAQKVVDKNPLHIYQSFLK